MEFKYNPGFSSDADLIESFVVRKPYLEMILENLRENTRSANQHVLVVGARGTGKTMLVRRVAAEVRTDSQLDAQWYPLVFAEESYQITSVGEFWLEALFHVADQTQNANWQTVYEDLRTEADEMRLRQRALAQLMDFADAQGKRILLVVENLNMLFAEQLGKHNDWELRHTLQNEPRLMLLGTATQRFEQIEAIQQAWFEFFTIYQLEALSLEDCRVLWTSTTGKSINENRIRPIQILTGGNPRLMRILIDFAMDLSLKDLMANLSQLIDEHTDYFKSHLDNLAAAERKVFIALLDLWDPKGARDIATIARMNVSQVSSLLNRLASRGAVMVVQAKGRKKLYQATERLYNIYYLMRRRSHPSSRVRAAVTFIVNFYQGNELVDATAKLANEACLLNPTERADHFYAYKGILDATTRAELREKLLIATPKTFLSASDAPEFLRQLITFSTQDQHTEGWQEFTQAEELFQLGRYEEVIFILDELISRFENHTELPLLEILAKAILNKGVTLGRMGCSKEAIALYDEVIHRFGSRTELPLLEQLAKTLYNKGVTLGSMGCSKEAIALYDEVIRRFGSRTELPLLEQLAMTLLNKGVNLDKLGYSKEAIALYDEVIRRFESHTELPLLETLAKALFNKGVSLDKLGCSEEAIMVYDEVIRRFGNCTELPFLEQLVCALLNKGVNLGYLGRSEEAITIYNEAIRHLEDRSEVPLLALLVSTLVNKGFRLDKIGRSEEAITVYDEVIRRLESRTELLLVEQIAKALYNKGITLGNLGRSEEAIAMFDEVIRRFENRTELPLLNPLANALVAKGFTLISLGLLEEAITMFDEVIRHFENRTELPLLDPVTIALVNKGAALFGLGRLEEAEQFVRKSLEIVSTSWRANYLLASLLLSQKKWAELWNIVPTMLTYLEDEEVSEPIINLVVQIAATGHAAKILQIVSEAEVAPDLEPLIVGLQIFLGEQPLVAQEILEIGQDVAQRIREVQQVLQEAESLTPN
jgi:tetratricopeptide (TPR) repeat protein